MDSHTNSFVEECFYVLQQSSSRALATGSATCVCGVLNTVVASLDTIVLGELLSRLERAATACGTVGVVADVPVAPGGGEDGAHGQPCLSPEFMSLAVCVNNVEVRQAGAGSTLLRPGLGVCWVGVLCVCVGGGWRGVVTYAGRPFDATI